MLRLYGPRLAAATLLLDALKGVPAVLAAKLLALPVWLQGLVGLAVLLGHSYPIWFSFRGGKSVSSAFGVLLVLVPSVALITALCWALLAWRLRTAAAASLISALLAPLLCLWLAPGYVSVVGALACSYWPAMASIFAAYAVGKSRPYADSPTRIALRG